MKRLTILFVLIAFFAKGQAPDAFKYQAVMRTTDGTLLANKSVAVRISILKTSAEGSAAYVESHTVTTNSVGIVNLSVGGGTAISGNFKNINWGIDKYFIKIEMDPAGGSAFALIGTSQLLSVPYALYSNKSNLTDKAALSEKAEKATLAEKALFAERAATADGPWIVSDKNISYTKGKVSIGTTEQLTPSSLYIDTPTPTSQESRSNGIFLQANDVVSRGYPFWIRSNTSNLTYGSSEGQTLGRMLRMQDLRFGFDAIWDFGIDASKSLYIMGGNTFARKLSITTGGNVGINEPEPNYTLDVGGTVNAQNFLINGDPLPTSPWQTSGVDAIFQGGNVGIGKSNPSHSLDVAGQVNATGFLVNGVPLTTSNSDWQKSGSDLFYQDGKVTVGTSTQETPSMMYINAPIPVSDATKANGLFIQANDVVSRGYPLWIRSNTSTLSYGTSLGTTMGRMLRMQDARHGFDAIWDFGIDGNKSLYIMGGNNDFSHKLSIETAGNVGIGTENPASKLEVKSGDVYINSITSGVIMKSPNGSCWRMTVDNTGAPVFTSITCPN